MSVPGAASAPLLDRTLLVGDPRYGQVLLVRHAQQGDNKLNDPSRPRGGDVELSELGLAQADAVAAELAGAPIAAVYSSHMHRARMTAERIAARHGMSPVIDRDFREIETYRDVPTGATVRDVIGADGVAAIERDFLAHRRWDAFPMSETSEELGARTFGAFQRVLAAHDEGSTVVVVCHGGVINAIVRRVIGAPADMFFFPAHASITRLSRGSGRLELVSLNEHTYLHHAPGRGVTF